MIDHILEQNDLLCSLTQCVDVIACDDTTQLQVSECVREMEGGMCV